VTSEGGNGCEIRIEIFVCTLTSHTLATSFITEVRWVAGVGFFAL
jgi:hypothetical protein